MAKPRLLLVDDHSLLLAAMHRLLCDEFELVATATDGRAALAAFTQFRPALTILDIGLPLLNGIEVARLIRQEDPAAKTMFVTMKTERTYLEQALRAGAGGYVAKQASSSELLLAAQRVLAGHLYVSPLFEAQWGSMPLDATLDSQHLFGNRLTNRQREVLQLIAEGRTVKEMAWILSVSVRTIEFHKNCIVQTLGVKTTAELTRYALEQGMLAK